jgi:hypothetical protein
VRLSYVPNIVSGPHQSSSKPSISPPPSRCRQYRAPRLSRKRLKQRGKRWWFVRNSGLKNVIRGTPVLSRSRPAIAITGESRLFPGRRSPSRHRTGRRQTSALHLASSLWTRRQNLRTRYVLPAAGPGSVGGGEFRLHPALPLRASLAFQMTASSDAVLALRAPPSKPNRLLPSGSPPLRTGFALFDCGASPQCQQGTHRGRHSGSLIT